MPRTVRPVRAGVSVLVAGVLALAACGQGSDEPEEVEEVEETVEAVTTTEPEVIGEPWLDLEDPGPPPTFPLLLAAQPVGTVCLESAGDGVQFETVLHELENAFTLLGVAVVEDGCDAVVRIEATGSRIPATYTNLGTCWNGYRISGRTTLTVGGEVVGTWADESESEPPPTTRECIGEDELVFAGSIGDVLVEQAISEMFGPIGVFAHAFQSSTFTDVTVDDDVTRLLLPLLAREPDREISPYPGTFSTGDFVWAHVGGLTTHLDEAGRVDELETLLPLAPHLIALLECPDPCDLDPDRVDLRARTVQRSLELLSGEEYETALEWWSWWLEQP